MSALQRQRGAAIIVAMLIMALASAAAIAALQQQDLALRQLTTARDYEQATWVLKGGAHWARSILYQDGRISALDHGGELWASGLPRTDIEQGTVSGEITDQQGLFNVNNLALEERASARDIEVFRSLLEAIGLNADLAQAIADWIDADDEALPVAGCGRRLLPAPSRAVSRGEPARGGARRAAARARHGRSLPSTPARLVSSDGSTSWSITPPSNTPKTILPISPAHSSSAPSARIFSRSST